ncbi:MAG: hypothetical protein AAF564_19015 [Bacteroidota bacterium]
MKFETLHIFLRSRLVVCLGCLFILLAGGNTLYAQDGVNRHALLIGGLGGSPEHTERFKGYLFDTRKALVESMAIPAENVTLLGEASISGESFIDDTATAENIRAQFSALQSHVGEADMVLVVLFGHGSFSNGEARLNIPRRDLSQHDFAELVDGLDASRIVFINTSSASAPFVEALSADNRMVITATRTGSQKNETSFPRFLVESLTSPATDRDKDGRISVAEVFQFAAERTDQMFADNSNLATENALLDDNGDQEGSRLGELENGTDGHLASITYLSGDGGAAGAVAGRVGGSAWQQEKNQVELAIANLKSQKASMDTDAYYAELETLFVQLARGNAAAEQTP